MSGCRIPGTLNWAGSISALSANWSAYDGTLAQFWAPPPGTVCADDGPYVQMAEATAPPAPPLDEGTRKLAATAYGEGSVKDVFEEMAAIANVLVRQQTARGYSTIAGFIAADKTFAFAAHDGSQRYAKLMKATDAEIAKSPGMADAVRAATNALSAQGIDYSNGAYFWDGADIKSNYAKHAKVRAGIHFADASHNVYGIAEKDVPGEAWWDPETKLKSRGKWDYKFVSTAGHGGTIFWKYNPDFVRASGNKEYN